MRRNSLSECIRRVRLGRSKKCNTDWHATARFDAGQYVGSRGWLERCAGVEPERGGALLHYWDKFVYPNISATMLTVAAVIVCALNLGFYGWQIWITRFR